jgi:hydrogenase maturation protease
MRTLVLGLGNPILTDDGVGFQVARELDNRLDQQEVTVMETSLAGLDLLNLLADYDRVIIIDAIQTVGGKVGQIYRLKPEVFNATRHAATPHDINFATALELANQLNLPLPRQIDIFAIEVADATTFSEECTPKVKEAIPACTEMIIQELNNKSDRFALEKTDRTL